MTTSPYVRELLYRKAQGKKIEAEYEKKIATIFPNNNIVKIDLPETDNIIERAKSTKWIQIKKLNLNSFRDCLSLFTSETYHKELFVLIDEDWKYCGAIKTSKATQINPDFSFEESTSDELRIFTSDFSTQITIDYFSDEKSGPYECAIKKQSRPQALPLSH
ncbi:MAG: hypothetical protein ACN6O4_09900 [Pseudomonas sp.]